MEEIILSARPRGREAPLTTVDECIYAANNFEYTQHFAFPYEALQFLKANVPSIDILPHPTWAEYETALEKGYEVIGVSFFSYTAPAAVRMAAMARQRGVQEVWGGGYGVSTPGMARHFDRLFRGFADAAVKEAVEGVRLDRITHPVMMGVLDYPHVKPKVGYLSTTRGCTLGCEFCPEPVHFGYRLSTTPLDEIARVLEIYARAGVTVITLLDDCFLLNKPHAMAVVDMLGRYGMKFTITSRIDMLQGKIKYLRDRGLAMVLVGIESMNDESLLDGNKLETVHQMLEFFDELRDNNVYLWGSYIVGFGTDTEESIKADIQQLNEIDILTGTMLAIETPYWGTPLHQRLMREGKIIDHDPAHYDSCHLVWRHPTFDPDQGREIFEWAVVNQVSKMTVRKKSIIRQMQRLQRGERTQPVVSRAPWFEGGPEVAVATRTGEVWVG
jgi:hypothetical protein